MKFTLLLAVGLVILVIFVFLRNISATIIPSLALPLSIVGTFAAMSVFGYKMDNLSMMALTLAVGFVVDDAIVVLENIVRHMEMGKPRMEAALEGGKEIAFTILSMTLSLAAVFLPVLFMSGIVGRLFHEFAVSHHGGDSDLGLRFAQLDAHAVQPLPEAADASIKRALSRVGACFRRPARRLWLDLAHRGASPFHLADGRCGDFVPTVYLSVWCPRASFPARTRASFPAQTEFPQDASYESMVDAQTRRSKWSRPIPMSSTSTVFANAPSAISARINARLKPRSERKLSPEQVIDQLRPKLNAIPGARQYLTNPPLVRIGAQNSRSLYQFTLQAADLKTLYRAAADFEKHMRRIPGLTDV